MTNEKKSGGKSRKITDAKFESALENSYGIITRIAKNMGVSRKAVYKHLNKNPRLWDRVNEERDRLVDMSESILAKKIMQQEEWSAVKFALKTLGKHRGYTEKLAENQETLREQVEDLTDTVESLAERLEDDDDEEEG